MPRVAAQAAYDVLMGTDQHLGVFERVLGFRPATGAIKVVHLMNDLAQTLLGGAPVHEGDFLCRVLRPHHPEEGNTEEALRADPDFGDRFTRAYPATLGPRRVRALREAAALVLNFDGGLYKPGTKMASALATHSGLLGAEGFRRFRLGAYIARVLSPEGKRRIAALLSDAQDPITRAFRPLLYEDTFVETREEREVAITPYDAALGERLSTLLQHPLSKPTLLRSFALGASMGLGLKILGAGRPEGRPMLLALAAQEGGAKLLREEAVQAFKRGVEALDKRFSEELLLHPLVDEAFWRAEKGEATVELAGSVERARERLLAALRARGDDKPTIYWPDRFAVYLGRHIGCVHPKKDQAGWGVHFALTPELVEVLILMMVPPGSVARPWASLWRDVRDQLGIVVGASPTADAQRLRSVGVQHVSVEELQKNNEALLRQAVRRDVARRLPDGGAEAGGALS